MRAPGIGTAETHAATRNRHCRGRLTRAVPLRSLNLRAFREKAARAGIYAPVVRVEFLTLSRPMVPAPFISPSMAGWSAAQLASCVANALDRDGASAASGRTNVKV